MRRLVLVLFAFALICQGAVASMAPGCLATPCCAEQAVALADRMSQAPIGDDAQSAPYHAPCDAGSVPCDQGDCHCHAAALTALLPSLPALPPAGLAPIVSGRYLHPAAQHVPDGLQRPPRAGAR